MSREEQGVRRARWLLAVFSVLLVLGAAELTLRAFSRTARSDRAFAEAARVARERSIWMASSDPVRVYEHRPDYVKDGIRHTDAHGILHPDGFALRKPLGVQRVVVLGDSIAAGLDLPFSERFTTRLQVGDRVEVLNFGIEGYRTAQEARLLEDHAIRFEPDVVLLQYCLNDAGSSYTPTMWFRPIDRPHSYLFRRIARAWRAGNAATGSDWVPTFGPGYGNVDYWLSLYRPEASSWRSVSRGFARIEALAREKGAVVVLAIFPLVIEDWGRGRVEPYHAQVRAAGEALGWPVVDLLDSFGEYPVSALRLGDGDIYHPNARGHQIAAQQLAPVVAEALRERGTQTRTADFTPLP